MESILRGIVENRRARIRAVGPAEGSTVPGNRVVPLVPFARQPAVICEIKRKSPSKGDIAFGLDAVAQAAIYGSAGIRSVSVLTEPDRFGGSLADLITVKSAFPNLSVLRKDFLLTVDDIEVSYRAGADAVLLISSILEERDLAELYERALAKGMAVLVEVHSPDDVEKAARLRPDFTGINSRNLDTFAVDLCAPLKLKKLIDWDSALIFESGISSEEDACFAKASGFSGILVGEAAVRDAGLAGRLIKAFSVSRDFGSRGFFWDRLYSRFDPKRPLVKICGITRKEDAETAVAAGADMIGFVFAPSKRRADSTVVESCSGLPVLKAAVVSIEEGDGLPVDVVSLLDRGLIDVVQFHGNEDADNRFSLAFPYYAAVRVKDAADAAKPSKAPRTLYDAWSDTAMGGTGTMIPAGLLAEARGPFWLAGGLNAANVGSVVAKLKPELVDVSSGVEARPGIKDAKKIREFIKEARIGYER